jgi:plastocyanin domain-containing protein
MSVNELMVLVASIGAIAWVNWYFFVAGRHAAVAVARTASGAGTSADAMPEVVITVDNGYAPNTVRVKAGERTRLLFDRKDDSSCSEEVVFADFGIRRYLPMGERTAIEIEPAAPGRYGFTCGMGMLRGTVIADG